MKHIIRKAYYNYEKEEKWLNEMSAKGLALTDYSWCRYVFSETDNNEYTYRIELLDKRPNHPESIAYLKFLEENGVEYVSSYMRWVYLRKKTSEGPVDIDTDKESKIKHLKKINIFWLSVMWIEFSAAFINIIVGFNHGGGQIQYMNLGFAVPLLLIGIMFWRLGVPIRRKINELEKEKAIHE